MTQTPRLEKMVTTRKSSYQPSESRKKIRENRLAQILPSDSTNVSTPAKENNVQEIYTNVKSIPNYSAKIAKFLREDQNHGIHRRIVKKKFPRRRIITESPYQIFQADLIEYSNRDYAYANGGNRFILVVIDCFSKMVYARPVKRKNADYMSDAFQKIFHDLNFFPNSLITDRGLEFYNSKVQKIFEHYGINHYHTKTKTKWKASMAERVIRTLKTRLQKYFYQNKTKRWLDFLPQLVKNYNSTPHRTIGMSPDQVTFQNSAAIYKCVFGDINLKVIPRLSIGDKVRILVEKTLFEKGYKPNWSEKIYKIKSVHQNSGVVWYKIVDLDNKPLEGIRYYWNPNLVSKNVTAIEGPRNQN